MIEEKNQYREKRIEKGNQEIQKIIAANKLDRAKKDLEYWMSLSDKIGQPEMLHPQYREWFSCEYFKDSCESKERGECIFNRSNTRPCKKKWHEHHKQAHPKDDLLYVVKGCDTCKQIHDEETRFMKSRISEFESKLNNFEMAGESLSSIEATVEADLDSIQAEEEILEGKPFQRLTNYYERKIKLRSKAILIHGYKCMACGFDFEEAYGNHGSKFIEVHHLKPVSSFKEDSVDPKTEMAVVCSNCHRMIHRKKDQLLSLEELKKIIRS
jgi:predicted restriction endonuclease